MVVTFHIYSTIVELLVQWETFYMAFSINHGKDLLKITSHIPTNCWQYNLVVYVFSHI